MNYDGMFLPADGASLADTTHRAGSQAAAFQLSTAVLKGTVSSYKKLTYLVFYYSISDSRKQDTGCSLTAS